MFVILNNDKLFYSKNDGKFFTNDFAKAALFDTKEDAEVEWEENGVPTYYVEIESV